jgi:hypothetical protein
MKKLLTIVAILFSFNAFAQAENVTITPQARDLEFIATVIYIDTAFENMYDSIKSKFRVLTPPTGNTTVSITATSLDWLAVFKRINRNHTAIKANCNSRINTLLRAANVTYLTTNLDNLDAQDATDFQDDRRIGRIILRRSNN